MRLYINQTCPSVTPVMALLRNLGHEFTVIDIDNDEVACDQLREIANGNLSVPTLVISDTEVLVEPTTAQLMARFTNRKVGQTSRLGSLPSLNRMKIWLWITALLALGLIAFGLTYEMSQANTSISSGWSTVGISLIVVSTLFLAKRLPLLKNVLALPHTKVALLLVYSASLGFGLALTKQSSLDSLWVILFLLASGTSLLILVGRRLHTLARSLRKTQRGLGILMLFGFIALLLVGLLMPGQFTPVLALPIAIGAVLLLIANSLQLAQLDRPQIAQVQSLVITSIAFLVAISLVY